MSFRAALAGLALGLIAAAIYFLPGSPPPPPEAPHPAPIAPAPPPPDAALPEAAEPEAPDASLPPPEVSFGDGFCSPTGTEVIDLRFTLEKLALDELHRRRAPDSGLSAEPDTATLTELFSRAERSAVLEHAKEAAARVPDSPWPHVVEALAAKKLELPDDRLAALRRARQLLPNDPAIGMALADATRDGAELDEAIDGLGTYLAADPNPAVSRLRARLEVQRNIQAGYLRETRDGITVLWPKDALSTTQADELAGLVDRALDDAAGFTGTQRRQRLTVVVYPTRSELLAVSCVRTWAAALFDGVLRVVVATPGDGVDRKVVRHETLHAQLSPLAPNAPRWFHEGVAQSFAQERTPIRSWNLMVKNRVWVPFQSLDDSFQAFANNSDAALAYAQSYAMVEWMREAGGDHSVSVALGAFLRGADTPKALAQACGQPEATGADLIAFLSRRLAALDAATHP